MIGAIRRAFGKEPRVPAVFFVTRIDNPDLYLTIEFEDEEIGKGIALALFSNEDRAQLWLITGGLNPDEWIRGQWLAPHDIRETTRWAMRTPGAYTHVCIDPGVKWGEQTMMASVDHVHEHASALVRNGARAVVLND